MSSDQISKLVTENLAAVGLKGVEERSCLARSIICDITKESIEPEVLLYDEPTAGLDPIASTVVEDLIRSVHTKDEDAIGEPGKIDSLCASYSSIIIPHWMLVLTLFKNIS
ncbi:hypothetical protein V6Z11_D11G020800 [Gossypium hirsutum]